METEPSPSSSERQLPGGTVTFLFTDIEGSTELLKRLGERYADLLAAHRRVLRAAFQAYGGREVDTQGDAFFYSFPRATEAVAAAVEAQRGFAEQHWSGEVDVRVRMGLHTGEPLLEDEGYVGMDVHRAARIAHAGHGGQVLVSETTAPLSRGELPQGVSLQDLGRHRLKDMRFPERIYQLVIEGLGQGFPPLKSLETLPEESPLIPSPRPPDFLEEEVQPMHRRHFVAREAELAWLHERLGAAVGGKAGLYSSRGKLDRENLL